MMIRSDAFFFFTIKVEKCFACTYLTLSDEYKNVFTNHIRYKYNVQIVLLKCKILIHDLTKL